MKSRVAIFGVIIEILFGVCGIVIQEMRTAEYNGTLSPGADFTWIITGRYYFSPYPYL